MLSGRGIEIRMPHFSWHRKGIEWQWNGYGYGKGWLHLGPLWLSDTWDELTQNQPRTQNSLLLFEAVYTGSSCFFLTPCILDLKDTKWDGATLTQTSLRATARREVTFLPLLFWSSTIVWTFRRAWPYKVLGKHVICAIAFTFIARSVRQSDGPIIVERTDRNLPVVTKCGLNECVSYWVQQEHRKPFALLGLFWCQVHSVTGRFKSEN